LKTEAFWAITNANRAREETELAEVLAIMGNPSAVTLSQILKASMPSIKLQEWLSDRKNRRVIPKHMEAAEYVYVHNPDRKDGLWSICGLKQTIYARIRARVRARWGPIRRDCVRCVRLPVLFPRPLYQQALGQGVHSHDNGRT